MTRQRRHRPSGWGRTRLVAAASAMAFAVTVASGATASGAQEPETGTIRNGTAQAVAGIGKYAPGVGNLELAMTSGVSIAEVTNNLAQASAQNTNLGLIGTSATAEGCDGGDATFTEDDLPKPTVVDNRDGDDAATRDEFGTDGSPQGGGRMHVEAYKEPPVALAEVTASATELDPVLSLGGGKSHAEARVLPGEGREAYARSEGDLNLGGVVTMSGMVWHALHRTGVDPEAEAGFEWGESTVGGQSYDSSQTEAFQTAANAALAPLGVTITMPVVERFTEPNDIVRVTPMRIELRDSPVGKTVLGPGLDATRDLRGQLFNAIADAYCGAASALLVGDVVLSVISGTGFFYVELGGAMATSADLEIFDPFADLGGGVLPSATSTPSSPIVTTPRPTTAGSPTPTQAPAITTTPAPVEIGGTPVAAGPIEEFCESIHPSHGSCRDDSALAVGLLGLLGTIGVGGADWVRRRKTLEVAA